MKTELVSQIRWYFPIAGLLFPMLCAIGCSRPGGPSRLYFAKTPSLKLGITTQCFVESVPMSVENARKFVDFADSRGFHWMELRDPDAVLTAEQCRDIAEYARHKQIEIAYASQRGLLDSDFWPVFQRGLKNAAVFPGPRTIRALIVDQKYVESRKQSLTAEELRRAVETANQAAAMARQAGLRLIIENGAEPLSGDGNTRFGLSDFFQRVGPDVYWQFDTANFFKGEGVRPSALQAEEFLRSHIQKLVYIHLKSAKNDQVLNVLGENEYEFSGIFNLLHRHGVPWVALELPALPDEKTMRDNIDQSLVWLREKGYIR